MPFAEVSIAVTTILKILLGKIRYFESDDAADMVTVMSGILEDGY